MCDQTTMFAAVSSLQATLTLYQKYESAILQFATKLKKPHTGSKTPQQENKTILRNLKKIKSEAFCEYAHLQGYITSTAFKKFEGIWSA